MTFQGGYISHRDLVHADPDALKASLLNLGDNGVVILAVPEQLYVPKLPGVEAAIDDAPTFIQDLGPWPGEHRVAE
jgi:hypothetical protein